ncbi:MAG: NAD-dependent epimerase/dehydratase family protein [Bacteroidales bacterium]|nr:NAD-dependent epimerase/dehydratase family protein [Bacteroidales bacterium]
MNITVTGGTGMTGSYLLFKLAEKGYKITALRRNNSNLKITRKIFNVLSEKGELLFSEIKWVDGNILDFGSVDFAVKNADFVYHTAAVVSFKPKDRKHMIYNNVQGTANVVNACLANSVKKLCHVSSVAAIGNTLEGELLKEDTELTDFDNISDYAVSKFQSEREVWRGIAEGLNAVIVNPSIILGAGNWEAGSPRLIKTIWDGLKFYTRGVNGFVDVRDVVDIMILLTESDISNERFIINSENISYKYLFEIIAENLEKKCPSVLAGSFMLESMMYFDKIRYFFTGKEPRLTKYTLRSAQQKHSCSNEKITSALNFGFIPVEQSIKEICQIFLKKFNTK